MAKTKKLPAHLRTFRLTKAEQKATGVQYSIIESIRARARAAALRGGR